MSRRNLILLFGFVALVAVVAIVATADMNEERGTRADETYLGDPQTNCVGGICHTERVANWSATDHADADGDFQNKHGTNVYKTPDCGPCHTLGWNEVELGGFNISQEWNSTHNQKMWTIQCENCHGPASGHGGDPAEINIDRDPLTACSGHGESDCHYGRRQWGNETLSGWNTSMHAPHENFPETDSGMNTYCARCKSPSQFSADKREDAVDIPKEIYKGITCGDCHNPHNVTGYTAQLNWDPEDSCDVCHNGGHHETMRTKELSDVPSVNRNDYPYMDEVSCVECHMWSSPRELRGTEYEHVGHSMEPTIDACLDCHTNIFEDIPATSDTVNWTAWEADYAEVYEEWEEVVHAAQERHEDLIFIIEGDETTKGLLDEVEEIMEVAEGNGTWTDHLEELFEQAEFDYELAEHKAKGAHNPAYGIALLEAAKDNFTEILEELSEGTINGYVTDESDAGMAGVFISINGYGTTTASDGFYTLMMDPGTYEMKAFKKGSIDDTASGVVAHKAAITWQNFTLAPDFDNDGTADTTDTDDDNDGLPDDWETTNGLNPKDPTDASADGDGDGMTNLQEYTDGKDPQVADKEEAEEEADTTLYLSLVVLLIIIIAVLGVMLAKKGGGAPALPPETEEPREEPPLEESEEIEEEEEVEE